MALTRVQLHDLLYLVRASSFVPGMTKDKKESLEISITQELRKLDKLQGFVGTLDCQNFEDLKTKNKALATRLETLKQNTPLINSLGTVPQDDDWKDMPIYVYSSLEAFGHYLINQKPYPSLTDWQGYPVEYINYVAFAKDFLKSFANGSDYLWDKTNNLIFEFQQ